MKTRRLGQRGGWTDERMGDAFALCCLTLRHHGFTYSEIAAVLRTTRSTVAGVLRDVDRDTLLAKRTVTAIPAVTLPSVRRTGGYGPLPPALMQDNPPRREP